MNKNSGAGEVFIHSAPESIIHIGPESVIHIPPERLFTCPVIRTNKRRYPIAHFKAFWEAGRRYGEMTKRDALMHRVVVDAVNGLTNFLSVERKRVPEVVIRDAERLESIIFAGYDCYFEGDEPPGF